MTVVRTAALVAIAVLLSATAQDRAQAQTKITVGKVVGGVGLHIPSYIAMDKGFFKDEGLDARFVELAGKPLMTAGLTGNVDFIPIPSGGAQAVLKGAQLRYIVGQSLKPQWIIVVKPEIKKPEDLQGQDAGLCPGRRRRLRRRRHHARALLQPEGRPRLQGDPVPGRAGAHRRDCRTATSMARWCRCLAPTRPSRPDFHVLIRTGDYLPRAGGTFWSTEAFFQKNPDTVKKFIRAIARGVMYYRTNKEGSYATMKQHLGVQSDEEASVLWDELHETFAAELPAALYREIFESRRLDMIAAGEWPKDKPLPDPEQYLARDMLDGTLKAMNYVPTKLDAKPK